MENLEKNEIAAANTEDAQQSGTPAATPAAETTAATKPEDDPEVKRLIEEAEQRGYVRGCNEQIEKMMSSDLDEAFMTVYDDDDPCPGFLSHIRPSFWE